ncbi:transcriptional regulator [Bacillus sp. Soil745]|jgi:TetR/AcrR family transcriptional regulator, transcriptional repressor for nem operon|uniref:TetR/AcrR family transcriptional regulator n=2 Tax=Peribacillus frigoritolerans TaxID=450367 RepID=UPI00070E0A4E|nr:TetR/AcrR family transcriptional regulator [Peribacillus frigoritolerans]KRF58766.1 transcriptional regulator [Bacillus sp. Soil745]PAW29244.1 TetR family transcriptional regulator [Peribacillus simplex]MED3710074.1 TetR/AcrR family transcriptional regulator [Peribacillus frigoritolerans]MED3889721.1 TetR/AcrR family transcriptional regulator [Peribacillus frigoritolerans]ULM98848.1 TetR/AcrR family transcriptional regulator [Peribacillus frigoritolerans]
MVRQREFDEEKALDDAMLLFWEKGYKATSLSDLTAKMGIQRPSLYSAFGDKEKLFEAALRKYTKLHASHIRKKLQNNLSVKEAFHTFFEDLVEEEYKESPNKGCFCINTMVELAPHDEKFEILTREHQMYLSIIFQETIVRGIRSGELESSLNAKVLAQTLVVSLIGLTVLMKSRPERSFVENSVAMILSLLK